MEGENIRNYWWYYVEEDASLALPSKANSLSASLISTPILGGPEKLERAINRVLGERQKWAPFSCVDRDRLEEAYHQQPLDDGGEGRSMAVCGHSGQRLWLADLEQMQMSALYWKGGSKVALRRSQWMIMPFDDDRYGGIPCPPEWECLLEEKFQENADWTSDPGEVIEEMASELLVDLEGTCLGIYQLSLKRGITTMATLVPAPVQSYKRRSLVQGFIPPSLPKPIRLIRGYPSYHGAVISAMNNPSASIPPPPPSSMEPSPKAPTVPPSPFDEPLPPGFQSSSVQNLVFVVHGIGQKLADKVGYGFVSAINSLRRSTLKAALDNGLGLEDLYVLPIQWRVELEMGSGYFPEEEQDGDVAHEFENLLNAITLPTVPTLRTITTDVTADVLLYMTSRHFDRIMQACVNEMKRIYGIFKRWNPGSKPKITLVGHSLGAALVYDILECVVGNKDDDDPSAVTVDAVLEAAEKVKTRLGFEVENFFSLGSPLPFFLLLKHLKPVACTGIQRSRLKSAINTAARSFAALKSGRPPRMTFFCCRQYYNLFMPYDPVAHRMEPLVIPPKYYDQLFPTPALVPYHKGGVTRFKLDMVEMVTRTKFELFNSLPNWIRLRIASGTVSEHLRIVANPDAEDAEAEEPSIPYPMNLMHHFNDHGRIDYVLQDNLLESAYLSSLSSHFTYWSDVDVSVFLVKKLFNKQ